MPPVIDRNGTRPIRAYACFPEVHARPLAKQKRHGKYFRSLWSRLPRDEPGAIRPEPDDCPYLPLCGQARLREILLRKEVIQPLVPQRLPCYDFIPVTNRTLGVYPPCGSNRRLRVQSAPMM